MDGLLLEIHIDELGKLRAREALHDATVVALGSGRMKPNDAARLRRSWMREADLERSQKVTSRDQLAAVLGAVGIGIRGR